MRFGNKSNQRQVLAQTFGKTHISWQSDNPDIISNSGAVTRPLDGDVTVKLVASISYGEYTIDKEFSVTVIADYNIDEYINEHLDSVVECETIEMLYYYNDVIEDLQVYLRDDQYVKRIDGRFSDVTIDSPLSALLSLYYVKSLIGSVSPKDELVFDNVDEGEWGEYYTFTQVYNGIDVFNGLVTVGTDTDGQSDFLNASFVYGLDISTIPTISGEQAIAFVEQDGYTVNTSPALTIYTIDMNGADAKLAWECTATSNGFAGVILIDAHSGELLLKGNTIDASVYYDDYTATGIDNNGSSVSFPARGVFFTGLNNPAWYTMEDSGRRIIVYNEKGGVGDLEKYLSSALTWADNTDNRETISTYQNVINSYDYFEGNRFKKNDFFGNEDIAVLTNSNTANASATFSTKTLKFAQLSPTFLADLGSDSEIVGHEFAHFIINVKSEHLYNATVNASTNPNFTLISIKEAYADVFAFLMTNSSDWVFGDNVFTNVLARRDASTPNNTGNPEEIGGTNFVALSAPFSSADGYTNSTIISHAAYQIHNNVITDKGLFERVWYESLDSYSSSPSFEEVRLSIVKAAKKAGLSHVELNRINYIFDEMNYPTMTQVEVNGSNTISGNVVETNSTLNVSSMPTIPDVTVTLFRANSKGEDILVGNTTTDGAGTYSFSNLIPGNYELHFQKDDFLQTIQYVSINASNYTQNTTTVELISSVNYSGIGSASGRITDSVTTTGVSGLTLQYREGIDNFSSTPFVSTGTTGANGAYQLANIAAGHYTVEIVDNRPNVSGQNQYITTYFNIKVLGGTSVTGQDAVVSNTLNSGQLRIVLRWGENPRDLDSHLTGPGNSGGSFHVYYVSRNYYDGTALIANLDLDDTTSFGPETTTLYVPTDGTYTFYVYNYSGGLDISASNATVTVYVGNNNTPSNVFSVPKTNTGRYWTVFRYVFNSSTRTIVPVNIVGNAVQ
ncbi:MAG: carboxypeptidase regulatory-like domain-containing protein, partial [Clostridiales bacterium]|nr:carboxypeptidase regulatory-like domain-containing protein [Clostridiales bacterium]